MPSLNQQALLNWEWIWLATSLMCLKYFWMNNRTATSLKLLNLLYGSILKGRYNKKESLIYLLLTKRSFLIRVTSSTPELSTYSPANLFKELAKLPEHKMSLSLDWFNSKWWGWLPKMKPANKYCLNITRPGVTKFFLLSLFKTSSSRQLVRVRRQVNMNWSLI